MMVMNISNQQKLTIILKLHMNYLKVGMLIGAIAQVKKLKNKKKELDKKNFLIFIIENGEILQKRMLQRI